MIKAGSLSKKFKLYRSPSDRLKEIITRKKFHKEFYALKNVSFEVADGETLGIVGQNGAGKSTLLKILTGILLPDSGFISANGKITGLLELGTGFNYEMTGIDNIYMNGILLGMNRKEIDKKKRDIIDFAELGDFIFEPIKIYSSGMAMRLAFSVAIHAEPKCFVVDEALSVGDAYFQQKCIAKIKEFRQNGGSIIFVSHDTNAIKMLCDKSILLDNGAVIEEGNPERVVNSYNFLISKKNDKKNKISIIDRERHNYGTFEANITRVSIVGENSKANIIRSGEGATMTIEIESHADLDEVNIGILIRDRFGQDIFGTSLMQCNNKTITLKKGRKYICMYRMNMNIGYGKYSLTTALAVREKDLDQCLHWLEKSADFEIAGGLGDVFIGIAKLYPEIQIKIIPGST